MKDFKKYDIDKLLQKISDLEKENNELLHFKVNRLEEENIILKKNNVILTEDIKTQGNQIMKLSSEISEIKKMILKNPQNVMKKKNAEIKPATICEDNKILEYPFEYELISKAISSRLNKQVKNLKILYIASQDGDNPKIFHDKCDDIINTLCIYKSSKNRRFGGFTTQKWNSSLGEYIIDINAFLFSLDKKKIYPINPRKCAIFCSPNCGPSFGGEMCEIEVFGNEFLNNKKSTKTIESEGKSYIYNEDENALSEDGKGEGLELVEVEVYEVIL
jgi:hypothetical protein